MRLPSWFNSKNGLKESNMGLPSNKITSKYPNHLATPPPFMFNKNINCEKKKNSQFPGRFICM